MIRRLSVIILIFLIVGQVWAQTKPASPIAPTGDWATNMIRAYVFNEGSGTSINDLSPVDANGTVTNTDMWGSDAEGAFITTDNDPVRVGDIAVGLPGASIQAFSFYFRAKYVAGENNYFLTTYSSSNIDMAFYDPVGSSEVQFIAYNAVLTQGACDPANNTLTNGNKYNIIGTYAGDSLRLYVNGVKLAAAVLTGNLSNRGYTTRLGQQATLYSNHSFYTLCVWQRVLSAGEIAAIESDPYIMFRASSATPNLRRQRRAIWW